MTLFLLVIVYQFFLLLLLEAVITGTKATVETCSKEWPMVNRAWGAVREAPGNTAAGLLPQEHFVPWIVLEYDFLPLVTNISCQLRRYVFFLLDVRPQLQKPIWPVYPEPGYGIAFVRP